MRETCVETQNPGTAEVLRGQTGVREVKSQPGCGGSCVASVAFFPL